MRILLLAPHHSDLPDQPKEIDDLVSVLDAELVTNGEIKLLAAIKNAHFDGVWISSHADANGVLLEGAERLDAAALAQYLSAVSARWVVINSCESYEFVDQLQRYYPVDVVAASIKRLGDRPAWRTAALIARHLSRTEDLREALIKASPGGAAPYRYWPSPQNLSQDGESSLTMAVEHDLRNEILAIKREVQLTQLEWQRESQRESQVIYGRLVSLEGRADKLELLGEAVEKKIGRSGTPDPAIAPDAVKSLVRALYLIGFLLFAILGAIAIYGSGLL